MSLAIPPLTFTYAITMPRANIFNYLKCLIINLKNKTSFSKFSIGLLYGSINNIVCFRV